MPAPLPSEHKHWPSWFYPPETDLSDPGAHGRIFWKHEDVPSGWVANLKDLPPPPPIKMERRVEEPRMSRQDLRKALDDLGEVYPPNAGLSALQKQYDEAIAVLQEQTDEEDIVPDEDDA